eukprot:scaffold1924_cov140-Skeletonema_menzelii.AAC.32
MEASQGAIPRICTSSYSMTPPFSITIGGTQQKDREWRVSKHVEKRRKRGWRQDRWSGSACCFTAFSPASRRVSL